MTQRWRAALVAWVVLFSFPGLIMGANDGGPEVRQPRLRLQCDKGPKQDCPCVPTPADPNGICSNAIFRDFPFFENGPQCVPVRDKTKPKASGILTIMVDDRVDEYPGPPGVNQAFTVLLEIDGPTGRHLLSDTYQNIEPSEAPRGAWRVVVDGQERFEPITELGFVNFFDPSRADRGFLKIFKPFLFLAPESELGAALREIFVGGDATVLPIIISKVDDLNDIDQFENNSDQCDVSESKDRCPRRPPGQKEPLATVVRLEVDIAFVPIAPETQDDDPSGRCIRDQGLVCYERAPGNDTTIPPSGEEARPGSTIGETSRVNDSQCGGASAKEVVYEWTPASDGRWVIETRDLRNGFDSIVSLREVPSRQPARSRISRSEPRSLATTTAVRA